MLNWQETALLFPGQGSQVVGMGKAIAEHYPIAANLFEQANDILGVDLTRICWEGPEDELNDTYNTQPALFVTSMAIMRALQFELEQRGLPPAQPAFVAGHSLGELSALAAAGAMDFEHGLRLVRERGRLMKAADEHSSGGMAAILGLETDLLGEICATAQAEIGEPIVVANDNCPGQIVISGHEEALQLAMQRAEEAGAKRAIRLPISIAAHSPLMARSAQEFETAVDITPIVEPPMPIVGNSTASPLESVHAIRAELKAQLTSPVRWTESVQYMQAQGVTTFVELGSKDVLVGLVKRIDRKATRANVEQPDQLAALLDT
jgi:[acyl-carrier-protein] S-malonyltransferase